MIAGKTMQLDIIKNSVYRDEYHEFMNKIVSI